MSALKHQAVAAIPDPNGPLLGLCSCGEALPVFYTTEGWTLSKHIDESNFSDPDEGVQK